MSVNILVLPADTLATFNVNSTRIKDITSETMEMTALYNQPFSLVDDEWFAGSFTT